MLAGEIGLLGAGAQAGETAGYVIDTGGSVAFYFVDVGFERPVLDAPVFTPEDDLRRLLATPIVCAVGAPLVRKRLLERWPGRALATVVGPQAWLAPDVVVGPGSIIAAGALLNRSVSVGQHVLVNLGACVSHDVRLGDYATIGPGCSIAGEVDIGPGALIGIGATILNRTKIGSGAVVGAGAVVTRDVRERAVVVGVPARELNQSNAWAEHV